MPHRRLEPSTLQRAASGKGQAIGLKQCDPMSEMGPKAKYSLGVDIFRFTPESGLKSDIAPCPVCVESRCGAVALGRTYLLPPLSFGGASMVPPWLRFHIPLIEPDRQISRIRLSDKTSRFRVQRHLQLLNIYRS